MQPHKDTAFFLKILTELESILARDQSFEMTCYEFLQQLMGTFLVPKGALLLLDPVENRLYLKANSGLNFDRVELRLDRDTFQALLSPQASIAHIDETDGPLAGFFEKMARKLQSLDARIWITLRLKNSVVGAITLSKKWENQPFDKSDIALLQLAGNMLAHGIHNHTLLDRLRRLNEGEISQSHVSEMRDALSIAPQNYLAIKGLTDEILRQSLKILGAISGAVFLTQPHNPLLKISSAIGINSRDLQALHLSRNMKAVSRSFQQRDVMLLSSGDDRKLEQLFDTRELILGPLLIGEEPAGIIVIAGEAAENGEPVFGEKDINAVKTISRQAGFAIDNFQRFRNLQQENRQLTDVYQHMNAGVIKLSQIGAVVLANNKFSSMCGKGADELTGLHFNALFDKEPAVLNLLQQALSSGTPAMEEAVVLNSFPDNPIVNISAAPIKSDDQSTAAAVLSFEKLPADTLKRSLFRRMVAPEKLSEVVYGPHQPDLKGEVLRVAVVVVRIANLHELCKKQQPAELSALVSDLMAMIRKAVYEESGSVERSDPGETIIVFGWPLIRDKSEIHAVNAFRRINERVAELESAPGISLAAGIACGNVIVAAGNDNHSNTLFLYGEALQTARHLCLQAGSGKCLVTDNIYQSLKDEQTFTRQKKSRVKGWSGSIQTWLLR